MVSDTLSQLIYSNCFQSIGRIDPNKQIVYFEDEKIKLKYSSSTKCKTSQQFNASTTIVFHCDSDIPIVCF